MIEVTDEMREAFQVAAGWPGPPWRFGPDVANGLVAVLAIVERDQAPQEQCTAETRSWDHFSPEQTDSYWITCDLSGPHDQHEDSHTGLTWIDQNRSHSET